MFTCLTNHDKALKMLYHKMENMWDYIFLLASLIGSSNDKIFLLANHHVFLIKLINILEDVYQDWLLNVCFNFLNITSPQKSISLL